MPSTFRILGLWLVVLAALAADEWLDAFGPDEAGAIAADAQLLRLTAPRISAVVPGSPAEAMGLVPGDLLVGLDGLRTYGEGEWGLVRLRRPCVPGEMRVAVWRAGALVRLATRAAWPVQRLGCDFSPTTDALERALGALARPSCGWESFPRRAGVALLRWVATAPPAAERAWIADLARLYGLLAEQRWAEAAAVAVQPPVPALAELAGFYHRLALRHAGGEQEPDPQRLGTSLPWYTVHYPYPQLVLPPLGAFTYPDPAFAVALATLREDPLGLRHDRAASAETLSRLPDEGWYEFRIRTAMIDGVTNGGWPFRANMIWENDPRRAIIAKLSADMDAGGPTAAWSRCCLICPLYIERIGAAREGPAEWVRPVLDQIEQVRATSPLLAYLAANFLAHAAHMGRQFTGTQQVLQPWLVAAAFPVTARPSRLIVFVRARDPGVDFQVIDPNEGRWPDHLSALYPALRRSTTIDELRQREKAAADDPDAQDAAALIAEWTECFGDACTHAEVRRLAGFALPGRAAGLMFDAFSTLLDRQSLNPWGDADWIMTANDVIDRPSYQVAAVAGARAAAAAFAWDDAPATTAAAQRACAAWGTTAGSLVLAEILGAAHGRADLAAALRQRIVDKNRRMALYIDTKSFHLDMHQEMDTALLASGVLSPDLVPLAISTGERIATGMPLQQQRDSVQLGLAVAYLAAGRREDALEALGRSFGAGEQDKGPLYWCGGAPLTSSPACCAWVLQRIIAGGPLSAAQRDRLRAQVGQAVVEDEVAAALGLPRQEPAPGPRVKSANDF